MDEEIQGAVVVLEKFPNSCCECQLRVESVCPVTKKKARYATIRPDWCPLIPAESYQVMSVKEYEELRRKENNDD